MTSRIRSRQRFPSGLVLVLGLVVGLTALPRVVADESDEAIAEQAFLAGKAALAQRNAPEAAERFREALAKAPDHVGAMQGLGSALLTAGDTTGAIVQFRRAIRQAEKLDVVPSAWVEPLREARRRLTELDPRGKELDDLFEAHTTALVSLGERHAEKDPDLAGRTVAAALSLRPGHARATALRDRMRPLGLRRDAMFDGRSLDSWDGVGTSGRWKVVDGVILAETPGVAAYIHAPNSYEGNFDVVAEMRLVESLGNTPYFAVIGAMTNRDSRSELGIMRAGLVWKESIESQGSPERFRVDVAGLKPKFDPGRWNTYEFQFRDKLIHIRVNGKELAKGDRPSALKGGFPGLLAQECRAEFRRLDVIQR